MGLVDLSYGPFGHPHMGLLDILCMGLVATIPTAPVTTGRHHPTEVTLPCSGPARPARRLEPLLVCGLRLQVWRWRCARAS